MVQITDFGRLGAHWTAAATTFRVFAPQATSVYLVLYLQATGGEGRRELPLRSTGHGLWELTVNEPLEGCCYTYRLEGPGHDSAREVIDICATNTVDSARRAKLTDLEKTNPPQWHEAGKIGPALPKATDAVICELHLRDLTISPTSGVEFPGGYLGWTEPGTHLPGRPDIKTALDHLVELGVTHVQLMPVQDFDGDDLANCYFWGYMTAAFNSPEGMYASNNLDDSRIRELKQLIAALHARGLGIILDVVYNHVGRTAAFQDHAPGYYFRHWADGLRSNGSGCGNDFRTESSWGRRFFIESLVYWVKEYGVDGFRFDLMGLIDRESMVLAEIALRSIKPDILLYGEPWAADSTAIGCQPMIKAALEGTRIGAFNDDYRNAVKGSPDGHHPGFIQCGWHRDAVKAGLLGQPNWAPSPGQVIQYLTCHDNLCLWDKLAHSRPDASPEVCRRMAKLGYFLVLFGQGVPFIHGGDEFFRTKFGDANSYQSPDAINQIDWQRKADYWELFDCVRRMIAVRKAHPIFRLATREEVAQRCQFHAHDWWDAILLELNGRGLPGETWSRLLMLVNGSPDTEARFNLPPGQWEIVWEAGGQATGSVHLPPQTGMLLRWLE